MGFNPGIIFVTAFENYAIKAIRHAAFDYILKPINPGELFEALNRFKNRRRSEPMQDIYQLIEILKQAKPGKIKLNTRSGFILIDPTDVFYCKAEGNYTQVQLINRKSEFTTQNMGSIESLLQDESFFRVSRSYLVNLKYLVRVDRKTSCCILEHSGEACVIKIPSKKIKLLESNF